MTEACHFPFTMWLRQALPKKLVPDGTGSKQIELAKVQCDIGLRQDCDFHGRSECAISPVKPFWCDFDFPHRVRRSFQRDTLQ